MNIKSIWMRGALAAATIIITGISACKESETYNPDLDTSNPALGTRVEQTVDSIFLYAKEVYLWNDKLPTYEAFNPRQYIRTSGNAIDTYDDVLYEISQIPMNPATGDPYEFAGITRFSPKFSYISDQKENNPAPVLRLRGSVDTEGVGNDIGIADLAADGTDDNFRLFIVQIHPGSPAEKAGFTRGTIITKINQTAIGRDFDREMNLINSLLNAGPASAELTGIKPDGSTITANLKKTSYTSTPVLASDVFELGGKKVGYLALARFSRLTNPNAPSDTNLDPIFARFATEGLTDLIVDLRYNGGGYVNTAEYLVNLIAPPTASGVMYTEVFNELMQNKKATILENQPYLDDNDKVQYQGNKMITLADLDFSVEKNTMSFSKKGPLTGIRNVVFIVTEGTASASELTISALSPFVNVQLVGRTTYGKPVGFFPLTLENRYDLYLSMFETRNNKGEGGYYTGMKPTIADDFDDYSRDFGDIRENYIAKSLRALGVSSVATSRATMSKDKSGRAVPASGKRLSGLKKPEPFVGMIETRLKLKQ